MNRAPSLRHARLCEAEIIHGLLLRAINDSAFYNPAFKANEAARFNVSQLRALINANPAYAPFVVDGQGQVAGFLLSGPEYGALAIHWCYLSPDQRKGTLAMSAIHEFVEGWEDGPFHKITAFAKPENRAPILMMQRNGFQQTALFKNHLFGEDVAYFERPLRRAVDGYPGPVSVGLSGRVKLWAMARLLLR